jgi:hypothetical protein
MMKRRKFFATLVGFGAVPVAASAPATSVPTQVTLKVVPRFDEKEFRDVVMPKLIEVLEKPACVAIARRWRTR